MKIAYHQPALNTINAHRTIYYGYKNAFTDLGHEFVTFTAGMNLRNFLEEEQPDIFITSSHFFWRKQLDYSVLRRFRDRGMVVYCKIDFWKSPLNTSRINEAKSLSDDGDAKVLIKKGLLGDYFFHVVEQGDERMVGFKEFSKKEYITIPLAVDRTLLNSAVHQYKFEADISFIGTNLPQKREYFDSWLRPLSKSNNLKLYGQDWTLLDRTLGRVQKAGQYFNTPYIRSLRKPKLKLEDEYSIYASSKLCVNLHEDYQRQYGGDCNERTFKIPASGCLEIVDDVACIAKYYKDNTEIIIAKSKEDWFDKVDYYLNNTAAAKKIAKAGRVKTLRDHTYHNRAKLFL